MARTAEGKVKAAVDKILKQLGIYYFKPVSNGMGRHGILDYVCCYSGLFIVIECKGTDKGKPTTLQQMEMDRVRDAGGKVYLATPGTVGRLEAWLMMLYEIPGGEE